MHAAISSDPFHHLEGQSLRHIGLGVGHREVEGILPATLAKHQCIGMSLGGEERRARRAPGDDRVDRVGRAVHQKFAAGEIVLKRFPPRLRRDPQHVDDASHRIGGRRGRLVHGQRSIGLLLMIRSVNVPPVSMAKRS